jgi:hypothetical protein
MSSDDPNEIVAVYVTHDLYEAELIRNELRDAGISCELDGETQGGFTDLVETRVLVRAWDLDRARRIIGKRATDKHAPPEDETA